MRVAQSLAAGHLEANGPRRILLTTDAVGGIWTYSLDLARTLSRRRVSIDLAVIGPSPTEAQFAAAAAIPGLVLHNTGLPLEATLRSAEQAVVIARGLAAIAAAQGCDTIQLHNPAFLPLADWSAPVLVVAHSCFGTWWQAMGAGNPPVERAWQAPLVAQGLKRARTVVVPSHSMASALRAAYGVSRGMTIVHNGRLPAGQLVRDHQLPHPERHGVLAAGRLWDPAKNLGLLEAVAARMPIPIRAAGPLDGPHGESVRFHHLRLLGTLDDRDMALAMEEARIFASPARYEPFGLSVLEAAQAGLPLVLADIPTFRELWGGAAILLPTNATAAWAEVLDQLHASPTACRQLGTKARARAGRYCAERQERAMWDLHADLLDVPARVSAA